MVPLMLSVCYCYTLRNPSHFWDFERQRPNHNIRECEISRETTPQHLGKLIPTLEGIGHGVYGMTGCLQVREKVMSG